MKPLRADQYLYYPRRSASLVGLETSITEFARLRFAEPYHFENRIIAWDSIKGNEVTVVGFDEWAIARLLSATETDLGSIVEFDSAYVCVPLDVQNASGTVASLRLRSNWYSSQWEGHALSFQTGKDVVIELERALAAEPWALAPYELSVAVRGKIGWNGHSFFGEKKISRPVAVVTTYQFEFRVTESHQTLATEADLKKRRFTNSWPPVPLLNTIPNWVYVFDEEGRAGQDETTLKPASNQRTINDRMSYTAGEAWLPDGQVFRCMIGLDEGDPASVIIFGDTHIWEVNCPSEGSTPIIAISPEHQSLFPLRVVSQLSRSARSSRMTIRFELTKEGKMLPWNL